MDEDDKKVEVANEILFYMDEKIDQLCKEYGEEKVDQVREKTKDLWPEVQFEIRGYVEKADLEMAMKKVDEYFKLFKQEVIKSFD